MGHKHESAGHASPSAENWLAATWPFVRGELPASPGGVLEIGCGQHGGFVPMLRGDGHEVVGIDPGAPEGPDYRQVEFEQYAAPSPVDVVIASLSLHHVADLGEVLDRVVDALAPGGRLIVLEWASEGWDQPTAQWCFDRLPELDPDEEPGWLVRHRDRWRDSGLPWQTFFDAWRQEEGLLTGGAVVRALDTRFDRHLCAYGPHFFPDLAGVTMADEQAAIDAGEIQATGIRYAATRR